MEQVGSITHYLTKRFVAESRLLVVLEVKILQITESLIIRLISEDDVLWPEFPSLNLFGLPHVVIIFLDVEDSKDQDSSVNGMVCGKTH